MKVSYSVETQACPHCGKVLKRKNEAVKVLLIILFLPISVPFCIIRAIIKKIAFGNPEIPNVGSSLSSCPKCGQAYRTGKKELNELSDKEALNYNWEKLFSLCYILGTAILLFSPYMEKCYLLLTIVSDAVFKTPVLPTVNFADEKIKDIFLMLRIIFACTIVVMIIIYRIKLLRCNKGTAAGRSGGKTGGQDGSTVPEPAQVNTDNSASIYRQKPTMSALEMYAEGDKYYYGKEVALDYRKAVEWYRKAAEAGNVDAMNSIGYMYQNGYGVEKDYRIATEWYNKAEAAGTSVMPDKAYHDSTDRRTNNSSVSDKKSGKGKSGKLAALIAVLLAAVGVFGFCFAAHSIGKKAFDSGDFEKAIKFYSMDFLFSQDDRGLAARKLADNLFEKKNYAEAIEIYAQGGDSTEEAWVNAVLTYAQECIASGELDTASEQLNSTKGYNYYADRRLNIVKSLLEKYCDSGNYSSASSLVSSIFENGDKNGQELLDDITFAEIKDLISAGKIDEADAARSKYAGSESEERKNAFDECLRDYARSHLDDEKAVEEIAARLSKNENIDCDELYISMGNSCLEKHDTDRAASYFGKCKNSPAAKKGSEVLQLFKNEKYLEAAQLAKETVDNNTSPVSYDTWYELFDSAADSFKVEAISSLEKKLQMEKARLVFCAQTGSIDDRRDEVSRLLPADSRVEKAADVNNPGLVTELSEVLSMCGQEADDKILIMVQQHQFLDNEASARIDLGLMRLLSAEYYPSSLAEIKYVLVVDYNFQKDGRYSGSTIGVQEICSIRVYKLPSKSQTDVSGKAVGPHSPQSFSYTLIPPIFKSGGGVDATDLFITMFKKYVK